jgi:beta-phosphoglucomutase-like phosphatase (HAD superfamily)
MRLNLQQLRLDIDNLLLTFPELREDDVLRMDTLEGTTDIKEALEQALGQIENTQMLLDGLTLRLSELDARKQRFARRIEAYRAAILAILSAADIKRIELATATLSQRASAPHLVGNLDVSSLPEEFVVTTKAPNRGAIRAALMEGREIEGCSLSNSPPGLTIRIK